MTNMEKCMIAAVADNGAIGVRGDLPWHISGDLKYFKQVTLGCPVIMGRTTFESLRRPLPGRKNIVLSSRGPICEGVCVVRSIEEAYDAAAPAERCFIIGGASVDKLLIGSVDKLYLTRVHTAVEDADAFFPEIDPAQWELETRSELFTDAESGLEYEFLVYNRS